MDSFLFYFSNLLLVVGVIFFIVGTLAIIRFCDLYTRLHALSKIDNLGLGFIVLGISIQSDDFFVILKLIFLWGLVLLSSATLSYILSSHASKNGEKPYIEDEK